MTSATEELRRLLDERGVEWRRTPHYSSESRDNETVFEGTGIEWYANDHLNGRLGLRAVRYEVTPEQAVAATLGPRTCKVVSSTLHEYEGGYAGSEWEHELSCGDTVWWGSGDAPEWCPWCGAKVVS